jgi:VanZ family protein
VKIAPGWYRGRFPTTSLTAMRAIFSTVLFDATYQKVRYRTAFGLYLAALIVGSIPGARADMGKYASGLVLHTSGYAILTALLFSGRPGTPFGRAVSAVLTVMLMGAVDEKIQTFFPYRHGSVQDWLVDCAAAVLTALLLWAFWPKAGPTPLKP